MLLSVLPDGAPSRFVMHIMSFVALGLLEHSMAYVLKQNVTWGSDSRCLSEIRQYQSPSLPVWSVLSINSVNMNQTLMWNMNILWALTIGIPRLPGLFILPQAVSSTVELVNSVTSASVNVFNFAMRAVASKCFPMKLVPCSDGWRRPWCHIKNMMPALPVSPILQCNQNYLDGACPESFQAIGRFEPRFIEARQASKVICNVRLLKSRIKTCSFLEDIITTSHEVFKHLESDIAVEIWIHGDSTWVAVKRYVIVQWKSGP